jgi:hypothetical protein
MAFVKFKRVKVCQQSVNTFIFIIIIVIIIIITIPEWQHRHRDRRSLLIVLA